MTNTPAEQPDSEHGTTGDPANAQKVITLLGYAGLLPFVAATLVIAIDASWSTKALHLVSAYAFGIICFLTGSWWGLALRKNNTHALWLSNVFFLLCFFNYVLVPAWWPLAATLLLLAIFILEQNARLFPPFPTHYRTLRTLLTLVVGFCMLIVQVIH